MCRWCRPRWYVPGEPPPSPEDVIAGWPDVVVKPAISAGARDTLRFSDGVGAAAHVEVLLDAGRVAMVQPYLDAVDGEGEYSVVVLGGRAEPCHHQGAGADRGRCRGDARGLTELTDELRATALAVLAAEPLGAQCAWARVDVARDADGVLRLMELELTEPLLFLWLQEGAPDRLVDVVLELLGDWTSGGCRSPYVTRSVATHTAQAPATCSATRPPGTPVKYCV